MHGSAMTHLTLDMLKAMRVDFPPLEEQRRIADFLDAETARIDGLVGAQHKAKNCCLSIAPRELRPSYGD